jgi:hypothetical protein
MLVLSGRGLSFVIPYTFEKRTCRLLNLKNQAEGSKYKKPELK